MMVGSDQAEAQQIQRKSLLTLDQQNSCSDIFVSISGLIGTEYALAPRLLYSCKLPLFFFSCRSW